MGDAALGCDVNEGNWGFNTEAGPALKAGFSWVIDDTGGGGFVALLAEGGLVKRIARSVVESFGVSLCFFRGAVTIVSISGLIEDGFALPANLLASTLGLDPKRLSSSWIATSLRNGFMCPAALEAFADDDPFLRNAGATAFALLCCVCPF